LKKSKWLPDWDCGSKRDGIEAKEAVVAQLARALEVIGRYNPQRILTLGGECSVSVAPFSWLAERAYYLITVVNPAPLLVVVSSL
jgi:arginase family enzyme